MSNFDPAFYGPAVVSLLADAPLNELGPGQPNPAKREPLAALTPQVLAEPHRVADRGMALACCAALWLRHDYLDESHTLSQEIHTAEGCYWHAIMHRREGDFDNSKYWFRRISRHAIFGPLHSAARSLTRISQANASAAYLADQSSWDPYRFVDLCQRALCGPSDLRRLCMLIQQREWELLFHHCYREAIGVS